MDSVKLKSKGKDFASITSGLYAGSKREAQQVYDLLKEGFTDPRQNRMYDNPRSNKVLHYDPFNEQDTLQAANLMYGIRQWPFLSESDLIQRTPGRVFIGHSAYMNPNDPSNYDPAQALADFEETFDRYDVTPLGAEPMERPQITYLRNLAELRTTDQPSVQTLNELYSMHIDRGARSYLAQIAKDHAIALSRNAQADEVHYAKQTQLEKHISERKQHHKAALLRMKKKHPPSSQMKHKVPVNEDIKKKKSKKRSFLTSYRE